MIWKRTKGRFQCPVEFNVPPQSNVVVFRVFWLCHHEFWRVVLSRVIVVAASIGSTRPQLELRAHTARDSKTHAVKEYMCSFKANRLL